MAEDTQPVNVEPFFIPQLHAAERSLDRPSQGLLLCHTAHSLCLDKVRSGGLFPLGRQPRGRRVEASTPSAPLVSLLLWILHAEGSTDHTPSLSCLGLWLQRLLALCPRI